MTIAEINSYIALAIAIGGVIFSAGKHAAQSKRSKEDIESLERANKASILRIDELENQKIKVEEALNRTFVDKDYVFKEFIHKSTFNDKFLALESKIINLETKMLDKMDGLKDAMKLMTDILKGDKNG